MIVKFNYFLLSACFGAIASTIDAAGGGSNFMRKMQDSNSSSTWSAGPSPSYPWCDLSVASLNVGDVHIELPGKVGFESLPGLYERLQESGPEGQAFAMELGIDDRSILSIPQIIKLDEGLINNPNMSSSLPPELLSELEYFIESFTTERAGGITCDVTEGQPEGSYAQKTWRPYNLTQGWHYIVFTHCDEIGWAGYGQDATVTLDLQFQGNLGYDMQNSRGQNGSEFIAIVSSIFQVGNVGEEATNACCFPESEATRDCSAVYDMINSFDLSQVTFGQDGGSTGGNEVVTGSSDTSSGPVSGGAMIAFATAITAFFLPALAM